MSGQFGPRLEPNGGVTFRLWAPAAQQVSLVHAGDERAMDAQEDGWFSLFLPNAGAGFRYRFRIDGQTEVPDPASHFQPDDVFGPSEVIDHAYDWQCAAWRGRPWREAVFLEAHVGAFTREGSFRAMIERLDHLVETGITALELMPLADFPGRWNWGYDGVLLYAPDSAYGRPEDLRALVDAAHARGLMVFLDVVYNHFGPEGNYLSLYAPPFFTAHHKTPWGDAIDYRVPQVRAFAIENALHWLRHYRFDGLRLDAVHAIVEPGDPPLLAALSRAVGALARETGREIHLVLENDDNRASLLDPATLAPAGKYRAQWNDDYHHAWHCLLTREDRGYYCDYADAPRRHIARALADGYVYQGEPSRHRGGAARGEPSRSLPAAAFVNFLQNHDQVGNRAFGERLSALASPASIEAALAVTLLAPSQPLLFMGEEWDAAQPFPFFCDFQGELAAAVRNGRSREFAAQFGDAQQERIPDPLAEATFRSAILAWDDRAREPHAGRLRLVRELLALRHRHIAPHADAYGGQGARAFAHGDVVHATWTGEGVPALMLLANLSDSRSPRPAVSLAGTPIFGGAPGQTLAPWAVHWLVEER